MKGQVLLRLLVLFILFQSAYGILCYVCVSKTKENDEIFTKPSVIINEVEVSANATFPNDTKVPPRPAGPTKTERPVDITSEEKKEQAVAECIIGEKDVKDNWEVSDCPHQSRACYVLKGSSVETTDDRHIKNKITERGCFFKNDNRFKFVEFEKDDRKTQDLETKGGNLSATAKLTVCDELNGGEMLCNTGTMMGWKTFYKLVIIVSVFLLHFGPLHN